MVKLILAAVLVIVAGGLVWSWIVERPVAAAEQSVTLPPAPSEAIPCTPPRVTLGMTKDALIEMCGKPTSVNHQMLGPSLDRVQMSFHKGESYVYLTNGIVDAIQYAENGERFTWGRP